MRKQESPSRAQWEKLYQATEEFKRMAAWDFMYNDDIFGVQDPVSGEIGYCCVMGMGGEHFGLAAYCGAEGLDNLLNVLLGEGELEPDFAYRQNFLSLSFEDRSELDKTDLAVIKDLGLKFRGSRQWPQFRSYRPGKLPWYFSASECVFFTEVINQAIVVLERCQESKEFMETDSPYTHLVRVPQEESQSELVWADEIRESDSYEPTYSSFYIRDELLLKRLMEQETDPRLVLETDLFYAPMPVQQGSRPYFPKMCVAVEHRNGVVLAFETMEDLAREGHKCIDMLVRFIQENKVKPAKIVVANEETYYLFLDSCKQLEIKLEMVPSLPAVEEFKAEMFQQFQ